MSNINPDTQDVLQEYKNGLEHVLANRLAIVLLYGSQSRGTHHSSSDIDVLCIVRGAFDYGQMIRETSEITSEISLKYDVALSRTFVSEKDYRSRNSPFMMNVRKEGVPL